MPKVYRTGLMFSAGSVINSSPDPVAKLAKVNLQSALMPRSHPEAISPTAHYTGYVWYAHGQSHDAFATKTGRLMYRALRGANRFASAVKLPSLEGMLLARHRLIDQRLTDAIEGGMVSQIVEVACGLSPRGWRFSKRYGDAITYVEADLPGMLANKR